MSSKDSDSQTKAQADTDPNETLGYDFFPARAGHLETDPEKEKHWYGKFWSFIRTEQNKDFINALKCQHRVIRCFEENLMVRLLLGALKSKGCEVKLSRHVSCESCESFTNGGYDSINKQIVICSNNTKKNNTVCNVLSHELIHAFDDCRAKMDLSNIEHLACTEIRAANLMHCTKMTAISEGFANLWGKSQQQECVRWKARNSILAVRNVSKEEAEDAVDRVFDRCYPDLEPVGRIPRNPYLDGRRLYVEASLYGYTEPPVVNTQS
ncbi:XRCC6BP1 [Bugula neritina]|uniref:Mitochondrial inner membrane protease ATP23 n=1 Tax=Bugula neritina TaxID=10212 RepID=A0A7J7K370_BUGNE|nr:XRCC6BP1 [Bugula neritina]